jgi:hypothetical protein
VHTELHTQVSFQLEGFVAGKRRVSYAWARIRKAKNAGGAQPMANRRHPSSRLVEDLRLAIDCLPASTRRAMLEGLRVNDRIIVGAYVDGDGGVCPMLAAHRCGGRTDFLSFAKSWDRFTGAGRHARRATERELRILVSYLEASLMEDAGIELTRAISEHHELMAKGRMRGGRRLPDAADPSGVIRARRLLGRSTRSVLV